MTNETQTTKGTVKSIKKDGKGIQLTDGNWYSQFNPVECNRGDEVELVYKVNGQWKNIVSMKVTKKLNEFHAEAREDKAKTMLVSYAKDVVIAMIESATNSKKDVSIPEAFKMATNCVMECYNEVGKQLEGKTEPKTDDSAAI